MPKKKAKSVGGKRPGAGRKPDGKAAKVGLSLRVDPVVKHYLTASGNASKEVERLVRREMILSKCKSIDWSKSKCTSTRQP